MDERVVCWAKGGCLSAILFLAWRLPWKSDLLAETTHGVGSSRGVCVDSSLAPDGAPRARSVRPTVLRVLSPVSGRETLLNRDRSIRSRAVEVCWLTGAAPSAEGTTGEGSGSGQPPVGGSRSPREAPGLVGRGLSPSRPLVAADRECEGSRWRGTGGASALLPRLRGFAPSTPIGELPG